LLYTKPFDSRKKSFESIAFPNISTGIFNYPLDQAAEIAFDTVDQFLKTSGSVHEVIFCCFSSDNFSIYKELLMSRPNYG